jgi:hypothetical protein
MISWLFTIKLDHEPDDAEFDALYEAGVSSYGTVGGTPGEGVLECDLEAESLMAAIVSVVKDVRAAGGPMPVGVETELTDMVTLSDIPARLERRRTAESLRLLAAGKRGPGGFPPPVARSGHITFYSWAQVATWLHDELGDEIPPVSPDLAIADQALRLAAWAEATNHADDVRQLLAG